MRMGTHMPGLSLLEGLADAGNDLQAVCKSISRLFAHKVIALLQQAPSL